jgi:CDP-paratose 2-epimerase
MKILVTGAAGFIGTNFCLSAKKKGLSLTVLDNLSNPNSRKNLPLLKQAGVKLLEFDLRNPLPHSLRNIDLVIHLAAHCSTPRSFNDPRRDFLDNALGTFNVLEFARHSGSIPVIYASTIKVYPDSLNRLPIKETKTRFRFADRQAIDETYPIEPGSHAPYGASKYVGDLYCQEYWRSFGVPSVINRLSTVFGPHQHGTEEAGWISHFISAKKKRHPVTVYGTGKQVRDALWVEDLTELFMKQIKHIEKLAGRIYNIGGGKENALSILELVEYLNQKGGKPMKVKFAKERPSDLKVFICDGRKIRRDVGWSPKTSAWQGIDRLYEQPKPIRIYNNRTM